MYDFFWTDQENTIHLTSGKVCSVWNITRVPKIGNCKTFGCPIFQVGPQDTQISIINMYKLITIRHTVLVQYHGNYIMMVKFNYMLEVDILRNSSQKILVF